MVVTSNLETDVFTTMCIAYSPKMELQIMSLPSSSCASDIMVLDTSRDRSYSKMIKVHRESQEDIKRYQVRLLALQYDAKS